MNPATTLLLLRVASAGILLAFLVLIAWFSYQDVKLATERSTETRPSFGWLEVVHSDVAAVPTGHKYPLLRVTSIGRGAGNIIVLDDEFVSNEHALLVLRNDHWWLEDLGSRNGTFLNGAPLETSAVVSTGDIFSFGGTQIKLISQVGK